MEGNRATIQVYEKFGMQAMYLLNRQLTSSAAVVVVGDRVLRTGKPLSVEPNGDDLRWYPTIT